TTARVRRPGRAFRSAGAPRSAKRGARGVTSARVSFSVQQFFLPGSPMSKRIGWLALASAVLVAGGAFVHSLQHHGRFAAGEEAEEGGRAASEGAYWAIHYGDGGDAQRLHYESAWLVDAAVQERKIASAVPAGLKNY